MTICWPFRLPRNFAGRARLRFDVQINNQSTGNPVVRGYTIHAFTDASPQTDPPARLVRGDAGQSSRIPMSKHSIPKAAPFDPISAPDFLPPSQLRELQLERLQNMVAQAFTTSPSSASRMSERGLEPGDVQSLDDITRLPFCDKTDLRDSYPFGLFANADERDRPAARLDRHHRQADRRRLHPTGH